MKHREHSAVRRILALFRLAHDPIDSAADALERADLTLRRTAALLADRRS
jgi:flagellar biosynthesis regulator FlaF